MKVVVDTNVFVSAILSPRGLPAQILDLILTRHITLLISPLILTEYQEVLRRKRISLEKKRVEDFLQFISAYSELIPAIPSEISLPDPDDLPFLACALEGKADFLVTGNQRDFPEVKSQSVRVVSPREFLEAFAEFRKRQRNF